MAADPRDAEPGAKAPRARTAAEARTYINGIAPRLDAAVLQDIYCRLVTRCGNVGVAHEVHTVGRPTVAGTRVDLAALPADAVAWLVDEFRRVAG